jgi:hypothetical protein
MTGLYLTSKRYICLYSLGGKQPNELQENTVQVISLADCKKKYAGNIILNQQVCASAAGKDTCQVKSLVSFL